VQTAFDAHSRSSPNTENDWRLKMTMKQSQRNSRFGIDPVSPLRRRAVVKSAIGALGVALTLPAGSSYGQDKRNEDLAMAPGFMPYLLGKTVIVTGGNGIPRDGRSGLGFHQARMLANAGAQVIIASRNVKRGEEAVAQISRAVPGAQIRFESLDLANLASVAAFSDRFLQTGAHLDVLINNAGVMGRASRETTVDGFERVLATNTIGHFALTAHLLPALRSAGHSRVVWVYSLRTAQEIPFSDLQLETRYDYAAAYDNSKLANAILASELQRKSTTLHWGIDSLAAHPGVCRTNLIPDGPGLQSREGLRLRLMPFLFQPPERGALPILHAAAAMDARPGGFYGPSGFGGMRGSPDFAPIPEAAEDPDIATALWKRLEELSQISFG
jgi:NAD(P)-dependent dehydrogenase (short-subunit alcohol dehydrogenase family)